GYAESALADFYEPYDGNCLSFVARGSDGTIFSPDRCSGAFGAGSAISPVGFVAFEEGVQQDGLPINFRRIPITGSLIQMAKPFYSSLKN
ncbi:hypothetical protein N9W89_07005, partial [Hellea sp.]|nr:hypothetical protein [Hellea sp.]